MGRILGLESEGCTLVSADISDLPSPFRQENGKAFSHHLNLLAKYSHYK